MSAKLLLVLSDDLESIISKGEVTERYYNPNNAFNEIHIFLTNNSKPDLEKIQYMVGDATVYIYNFPTGYKHFIFTFGYRPFLLERYILSPYRLAQQIKPDVVRCNGNRINGYLAFKISKYLNVPMLMSLHINPELDIRSFRAGVIKYLYNFLYKKIEIIALKNSTLVLPVYKSIIPYLEKHNIINYKVLYNTVNDKYIVKDKTKKIDNVLRIITVGRQFKFKNPENIIRAIAEIDNVHLTIIGDGPLNLKLRKISTIGNMESKVTFINSVQNDFLCQELHKYDIFAVHTEYSELSKVMIEAMLVGLPIVINKSSTRFIPELSDDLVYFCEDSISGYIEAFNRLRTDFILSESLSKKCFEFSSAALNPIHCENRHFSIYKEYIQ